MTETRRLAGIAAAAAFGVMATGALLNMRASAPATQRAYAASVVLAEADTSCDAEYQQYRRALLGARSDVARRSDLCVSHAGMRFRDACCRFISFAEAEVYKCSHKAIGLDDPPERFPSSDCGNVCRCEGPVLLGGGQ